MEMTSQALALGVVWYAVFLFSITVHEAAHAWASLKLGDKTAYLGGQVTLDPIPHIQREPFGTILMPLISYALAGWMMGWASAPYDPLWADRHPRRAAWMALAGPASNLLVTIGAAIAIRVGLSQGMFEIPDPSAIAFDNLITASGGMDSVAALLSILFSLNLLLFLFNLLPLPPLDGSGALPLILPIETARRYQAFMRDPMWSLLGLVLAWNFFGEIFRPVYRFALGLLYG